MIEIGIGVLFAVLFVTAYLLVKKLLSADESGQPRWRQLSSHSHGGSRAVAAKQPRLFLTNDEMREHHSQAKANQSGKK